MALKIVNVWNDRYLHRLVITCNNATMKLFLFIAVFFLFYLGGGGVKLYKILNPVAFFLLAYFKREKLTQKLP